MASMEQRRERVRNGSRRRRDIEAVRDDRVDFDRDEYVAKHLPDEVASEARSAAHAIFAAGQFKAIPDPQAVRAHLEATGRTRAQLEAKYGELA